MRLRRGYLTGHEAVDIARMTGLELTWLPAAHRVHFGVGAITVHPNAVTDEGLGYVYLDLTRLGYWDRMRVAWARIGAHHWLKQQEETWRTSRSA